MASLGRTSPLVIYGRVTGWHFGVIKLVRFNSSGFGLPVSPLLFCVEFMTRVQASAQLPPYP